MLSVRFGIKQTINATLRRDKRFGVTKRLSTFSNLIDVHPEVRNALNSNGAIVALESTIITHGMPHPHNVETALAVQEIVRKENATPATIAIVNGRIKVGLDKSELQNLASVGPESVFKCSRRDLGYVLSRKLCGGTTVAGTSIIANMVGIKVFATGGIGGVHRDGHITMDISADLIELGRTPICVISSGIKSILDIPRTLEYLETQGVCVATYQSDTRDFPAFYTRSSGVKVPYNMNSPHEVALLIKSSVLDLQLQSGILIGVPIPEEHAAEEKSIQGAIDYALVKASKKGITGKEVTPFVLEAVSNATSGKSLESNMALIKHNAHVAAQIAVELSNVLSASDSDCDSGRKNRSSNVPVVVGGSILDINMTSLEDDLKLDGSTYKAKTFISGGGVGRNIAEGLYKLHGDVRLISAVGNDDSGNSLNSYLPAAATTGVIRDTKNATSVSVVICDKVGECRLVVLGDTKIHSSITPEVIMENEETMSEAPLILMDANLEFKTMEALLKIARKYNKPVFFEPTDMRIAMKPFTLDHSLTKQIKFISPNIYELLEIAKVLNPSTKFGPIHTATESEQLQTAKELTNSIIDHIDVVIVTLGPLGVLIGSKTNSEALFNNQNVYVPQNLKAKFRHYPAPSLGHLVNVSGAGDSFTSGFISAMLSGQPEATCVAVGFRAARSAIMSEAAVPSKYFNDKTEKEQWYRMKASSKEL